MVWTLDRLARSMPRLRNTVSTLEDLSIGYRSLTESIESTTAGDKPVFHIFGVLAEFKRYVIRERTLAGLKAASDRGRKVGRPEAPSTADLAVARALLSDPAITMDEVAMRLKVSAATLYRHLPGGRVGIVHGEANAQEDHFD